VLVTVPVVNVLLFLPLMALFPTALTQAAPADIAIQALYQGVIVNIFALMCVAYAINHLGTMTVSLFMSFVPVTTAMLAWLLLGEVLSITQIAGIVGCSLGLILYARGHFNRRTRR
jgi:drug/metabolite transporter (DMT)-like permease